MKILTFCALSPLLLSCHSQAETWHDSVTGLDWRYTIVDGGVSLGLGSIVQTSLAITGAVPHKIVTPTTIDGKSVVDIGDYAFYNVSSLENVTVSAGVTRIGANAFYQCGNLVGLDLPKTITRIEYSAFYGCTSLGDFDFPLSLSYIGSQAFYGCKGLKYVYIPQGVKRLEESVFSGCSSLLYVSLPPGFTDIGSKSFYECSSLAFIALPDSLLSIGASAFHGCSALSEFTIPKSTFTIGPGTFRKCYGLATVTLPQSVVSIGNLAFGEVTGISRIYTSKGDSDRIKDMFWASGYNTNPYIDAMGIGYPVGYLYNVTNIVFVESETAGDAPTGPIIVDYVSPEVKQISLTVTNVVVNYVVNSVVPAKAIPASNDSGFVNVITEVTSGGAVSVPVTWAMNYPRFVELYGSDFTKSLMKPSVKTGSNGTSLVWQDYVAGTDPTDPNSRFSASVTMVDGKPVVSWSPELPADEAAMRVYRTFGKVRLQDEDWVEFTKGHEAEYNFFKVTVEMQ